MLRHMLKLIWKRKSRNLMLTLEILIAFLIVFAIAAVGARFLQLYRMPVGFDAQDVWSVRMSSGADGGAKLAPAAYDTIKRSLEGMPEVRGAAFATFSPYRMQIMRTDFIAPGGGARVDADMLDASDDYLRVAGIKLAEGRWFSAIDDGATTVPVVIDRSMAERLFPGQPAIGKQFTDSEPADKEKRIMKVTGVTEAFRSQGELMTPRHFIFMRFVPETHKRGVNTILLKVRPGTARIFEQALNSQLKLIRSDLSYEITPLSELRSSLIRAQFTPLIVLGVIGAFMLAMVGFGLFGVLWQNTTLRIPEIGLRRAVGATSAMIYRQIIGEQVLLSSLAMLMALALLAQLPLTGAFGESMNWQVFAVASLVSMGVIYLISLLCSVYPGWRASRLTPTEALHAE